MATKYIYKIGTMETVVRDETINHLTEQCKFVLDKEQVEYAIEQLQALGNTYWATIDEFCLLLHFMEREGVTYATAQVE